MDYQTIRDLIANARKKTPVHVWIRHDGALDVDAGDDLMVFPTGADWTLLVGEWERAQHVLEQHAARIRYYHVENDRRNSALPLLDLRGVNARIEPGSFIREGAVIQQNSHDSSVQGARAGFDFLGSHPRLKATALQTVGAKGYDGFAIAVVD